MSAEITQMLQAWSAGDASALDRLLPVLYDTLREMAHGRLRTERKGHTLSTTSLVHEAYLRLVDIENLEWKDRAHFLALASRTMRRILVDYSRARKTEKRGADAKHVMADDLWLVGDESFESLLELDDALAQFEKAHPRAAKAVELHYFGGLTLDEVGGVLEISAPTAMRDLRFAEAWLANAWGGSLDL